MLIIGLTGGIGSGKSTVSRWLVSQGAYLIDADLIGREIVEKNDNVLNQLVIVFGEDILDKQGKLLRKCLGGKVFGNPIELEKLNKIVHPHLLKEIKRQIEYQKQNNKYNIIIVDAALLVEWGILDWLDKLLVTNCSKQERIHRLLAKGLSLEQINKRMLSQLPVEEKIKCADYVINTEIPLEDLPNKLKVLWQQLLEWER